MKSFCNSQVDCGEKLFESAFQTTNKLQFTFEFSFSSDWMQGLKRSSIWMHPQRKFNFVAGVKFKHGGRHAKIPILLAQLFTPSDYTFDLNKLFSVREFL